MSLSQKVGDAFFQIGLRGASQVSQQWDDLTGRMKKSSKAANLGSAFMLGGVAGAGFFAMQKAIENLSAVITTAAESFRILSQEVRDAYKRVSDLQKISDRLGTSFSWINKMRLVVADSNMTMNEFEQSMAAFQRNFETFSQGVGESKQTFESLKITPEILRSWETLENQLTNVIDRLSSVTDNSQRSGAAMRMYGEQGRKLQPLVQGNKELLEVLMKQAEFIGLDLLPDDAAITMDNVRDSFVKLNIQMQASFELLAYKLAPLFEYVLAVVISLAKTFQDVVVKSGNFAASGNSVASAFEYVGDVIISVIGMATSGVMDLMATMSIFMGRMMTSWAKLGLQVEQVLNGLGYIGRQISDPLGGASYELGKFGDSMEKFGAMMKVESMTFSSDLMHNYEQWKQLIEDERKAREVPEREIIEAVRGVGEMFRGEAMQRNASTMQKLYEKNNEILKAIRGAAERTADAIESDTMVLKVAP